MPRKRQNKQNKKKKNPTTKQKLKKTQQDVRNRAPYTAGSATTRRSTMPTKGMGQLAKSVHEQVCAVTDPFCYKARCAKWPDGQGAGTVAFQIRGRTTLGNVLAVYTTGNMIQFTGDLPYSNLTPTSATSTTFTMATNYNITAGTVDFVQYAAKYRIVSWGIIIRNVLPANSAQGTVIVRKISSQATPTQVINNASMYGSEVTEVPLYPGMECTVIAKTAGNTGRAFVAQNTNSTIVNGSNWDTIQVEILNGPTLPTCLDIEYVYNVEFQLTTGNLGLHQFVPPSAPSVPKIMAASTAVTNKATTIVEGGVKAIGQHVLSQVEDFFSQAGEDLLAALF